MNTATIVLLCACAAVLISSGYGFPQSPTEAVEGVESGAAAGGSGGELDPAVEASAIGVQDDYLRTGEGFLLIGS